MELITLNLCTSNQTKLRFTSQTTRVINNAFLNGELEDVYMTMLPGFGKGENMVYKLNSLYSLKQSPRALFDRFAKMMKKQRYQ